MRKQKEFNLNYSFSYNKRQNVTSFYYKMYDWIEIDFKYGDGVPSSRITNEIILQSEYKVIQTGTVWQNGYVTNETTGRKLGMSVNNKGRGRIKVCPPKFILGNNAQEVSIKESIATWRFNLKAITSNILNLVGSLPDLTKRPFEGPTCFIRGALSDRVAVPAQPKIKRFFPKNRIQTVPDAGHWPHTENRAEFLKILKSCLDENH